MNVFISYRRSDAQHFAGRLAERLGRVRGIADVFLDVDSIGVGEDFEKRIQDALSRCAAAIVVIGPNWLEPRLFDDGDFVRLEVREALRLSRVFPVLADGATMPAPDTLPDDLRPLSALNALMVRHAAFDRDMAPLIDAVLERRPPGRFGQYLRAHPVIAATVDALAGSVAAFVLLVLALAVFNAMTGHSLDDVVGGPGMAIVLVLLVLGFGAATPWVLRRHGVLR